MPWLAQIDARTERWPSAARWSYRFSKWLLVALGAYGVLGLAYVEVFQEHRIGLGSGIVVASILAVIKGLLIAFQRR